MDHWVRSVNCNNINANVNANANANGNTVLEISFESAPLSSASCPVDSIESSTVAANTATKAFVLVLDFYINSNHNHNSLQETTTQKVVEAATIDGDNSFCKQQRHHHSSKRIFALREALPGRRCSQMRTVTASLPKCDRVASGRRSTLLDRSERIENSHHPTTTTTTTTMLHKKKNDETNTNTNANANTEMSQSKDKN